MMDKRKIYKKLMVIGRATGCHQLPERSFSFRGKQFPVCARCTGVFIGEVLGIFLFKVGEISNIIAVVFSLIMFADWFVQYKFHYESNNIRRLITGLLCGYAFGNIIMKYLRYFMWLKTLKENVGGICHVLRKVWKRNKRSVKTEGAMCWYWIPS